MFSTNGYHKIVIGSVLFLYNAFILYEHKQSFRQPGTPADLINNTFSETRGRSHISQKQAPTFVFHNKMPKAGGTSMHYKVVLQKCDENGQK